MINIRRDVEDSFYRYKMPRLQSKIEGKGNGIKTVVPNMTEIARALARPPSYVCKYFGCELGSQATSDDVKDRYIVNGAHDAAKLQTILDGFISRFVLCQECLNPETVLTISQKGDIIRDCKACGKQTAVDMRHKLAAFILKNPPDGAQQVMTTAAIKAAKKAAKKQNADPNDNADDDGDAGDDEDGSDDELTRRIHEEAAKMPDEDGIKSQLQDWSTDVKPLAADINQLASGINKVSTEDNSLDKLADYVESHKDASDKEIIAKIDELEIRKRKAVTVLINVLFDANILTQLPKREKLFTYLIKDEKSQKAFLGGLEHLCGAGIPELAPKIARILKTVYDMDLVDEEVIIEWGRKISKKYVSREVGMALRKHAEPFLTWLETAEEESEEESDDDE